MATTATHVWIPSSARVLVLDSFVPVPRGTTPVAPALLIWPPKDPADVLDYGFDISPAITGNDGDGIATLDVSIEPSAPGDLLMNSSAADGTVAVMWFSQGQAGTTYTITVEISTINGRTINRSLQLPVLSLSSPAVSASAIETNTGSAITDQNGNQIITGD